MRILVLLVTLSLTTLFGESAAKRLDEAAAVFSEIMAVPEKGIPEDLLEKAHCIVIVPGMKKGAIGIGGKYGRGFVTCRKNTGLGWGAPGAVRVEGGSYGFQLGFSSTDVVMLVLNERGMEKLLGDKFTLGADASVAAGPLGRTAAASTNASMNAEILSWSRSKGLFAGVSLEGATLRNDLDENKELYGKPLTNSEVIMTGRAVPKAATKLISLLNRASKREDGSTKSDRMTDVKRKKS